MIHTSAFRTIATALLVFLCAASLCAQTGLGSLNGTVTDPSGAALVGVAIRVLNVNSGVTIKTSSDNAGIYNVGALIPGQYRVVAEKAGFDKKDVENVTVLASQAATVDIRMKIGAATTTVTVTAQTPLLNSSSPEQASTIEHDLMGSLPYAERSSLSAALLVPGVEGNPFSADQVDSENPSMYTAYVVPGAYMRVGGAAPGHSSILVDGSDITQTSFPRAGVSVSGEMVC